MAADIVVGLANTRGNLLVEYHLNAFNKFWTTCHFTMKTMSIVEESKPDISAMYPLRINILEILFAHGYGVSLSTQDRV